MASLPDGFNTLPETGQVGTLSCSEVEKLLRRGRVMKTHEVFERTGGRPDLQGHRGLIKVLFKRFRMLQHHRFTVVNRLGGPGSTATEVGSSMF